mgnify:CR=1 FL=1
MNWTFLRSRLALGAGIAGVAALGFAGGVAWTHNAGTAAAAMDLQAQHGFLGLALSPITDAVAKRFNTTVQDGLLVVRGLRLSHPQQVAFCRLFGPVHESPSENFIVSNVEADGLLATCLQHEMDHLNGVLFIDHLSRLKRSMAIKKLTKAKKLKETA